jgi:hypothetical protein
MPASRSRRFCQALLEETGGSILRQLYNQLRV